MTNKHEELIKNLKARKNVDPYNFIPGDVESLKLGISMAITVLQKVDEESQPFDVLQHLRDGGKIRSDKWDKGVYMYATEFDIYVHYLDGDVDCSVSGLLAAHEPYPYTPIVEGTKAWAVKQLEKGERLIDLSGLVIYKGAWKKRGQVGYIRTDDDPFYAFDISGDDWKIWKEPPAKGTREWAMEQDCKVTHESYSPHDWTVAQSLKSYPSIHKESRYDTGWSILKEPRKPGWYSVKTVDDSHNLRVHHFNGSHWSGNSGQSHHIYKTSSYSWIGSTRIELENPEEGS